MKKIAVFVLILSILTAMVLPLGSSAAGAVLLKKADFLKDTFESINKESETVYDFTKKFDLSKSTADTLIPVKSATVDDDTWNAALHYVTRTGYTVSAGSSYTVCFEVATVHPGWFGVPFLIEKSTSDVLMIGGALADNGETEDSATGTLYSQAVIARNRPDAQHNVGEGYNEHGWLFYHPLITKEAIPDDSCRDDVVKEAEYTTLKIEISGTSVTPYYLAADGTFVKMSDDYKYDTEEGSEIVLGAYSREAHRHGIMRNVMLLEGTGLTLDAIKNAAPASQGSASTGDGMIFAAAFAAVAAAGIPVSLALRKKED